MKIAFNPLLINKAENTPNNLRAVGFEPMDIDRHQVAHLINQGYAFSPQCDGRRNSENFLAAGYVAIDIDGGLSLEGALSDPFVQKCAAIVYTTPSHQQDGKGDRFRILCEYAEAVYKGEKQKLIQRAILRRFSMADQCTKDAARFFYGSKGSNPIVLDGILTETDIDELVLLYPDPPKPEHRKEAKAWKDKAIPPEEAKRILSFIPPQGEYADWFRICAAITGYYGELGLQLIEEWSPDYKTDGRAVERILADNNGEINMGTVIYEAKKYGYELPTQYKDKTTSVKPDLLVWEALYNEGVGYCTIGSQLHKYKDGYYQALNEGAELKRISEFFRVHHPKYSDSTIVSKVWKYLKLTCYVDPDNVNPPGLNVKNGFVQLRYDEQNRPYPVLLPHSPERVCTHKSQFCFEPEADATILDNTLNQMLDPDYQTIFLRNVAASLDLGRVRMTRLRDVRLLLLLGQGSNGKDMLRVWLTLLWGGHGVTSVPLQAFQAADKGRLFNLLPLATSRINWSSENIGGTLSDCQHLKAFATGDPIFVEEKGVQGFVIHPKAIGLFNVNEKPDFNTQKEAIRSRYGVVHFPYTFRLTPDPNKPYERQGDPRLKEDQVFISQHILPALFNRLVEELANLLVEGIDYSVNQDLFQDIMETGSHFSTFVREAGLVECLPQYGISPSAIHEVYEAWCEANAYLEVSFHFGEKRKKWIDPSSTDRLIRHHNKLKAPLEISFPNLHRHEEALRTVYGVRFDFNAADRGFVFNLPLELREKHYTESKLGDSWQYCGDPVAT